MSENIRLTTRHDLTMATTGIILRRSFHVTETIAKTLGNTYGVVSLASEC